MCFTRAYVCLGKTWAKISLPRQNQIVTILRKQVVKQAVGKIEENFEITAIPNRYKDTIDDLIDSSDTKSSDGSKPIDNKSRNALGLKAV